MNVTKTSAATSHEPSTPAPVIVAPHVRDLDELARDLAGWLAARAPEARNLRLVDLHYPSGAGMSHETILFDAEWEEDGATVRRGMVVRIKPTRRLVFLDDMFEQQYWLMELMHRSGAVPIATGTAGNVWLAQPRSFTAGSSRSIPRRRAASGARTRPRAGPAAPSTTRNSRAPRRRGATGRFPSSSMMNRR